MVAVPVVVTQAAAAQVVAVPVVVTQAAAAQVVVVPVAVTQAVAVPPAMAGLMVFWAGYSVFGFQ